MMLKIIDILGVYYTSEKHYGTAGNTPWGEDVLGVASAFFGICFHYSSRSNPAEEIQFLEVLRIKSSGSQISNYLICYRSIRIMTVIILHFWDVTLHYFFCNLWWLNYPTMTVKTNVI